MERMDRDGGDGEEGGEGRGWSDVAEERWRGRRVASWNEAVFVAC